MVCVLDPKPHETWAARRPERLAVTGRVGRRLHRALAAAVGGGAMMVSAGFVVFVQTLERREPPAATKADAIVALTGGAERIADAVELLDRGVAERLLITGVNEKTTREEIMRQRPELRRLFSCCVDLDYLAQNTIGNAMQTRDWVQERGFRSLLVVTSSYHMPRSLAELGHALPQVKLIPHPVVPDTLHIADWWREPATARLLAVEYAKYVFALARIHIGADAGGSAVASQAPKEPIALRKT